LTKALIVRLTEIAEILGATHQRAGTIIAGRGFPRPVGLQGGAARGTGARSGRGSGEGVAAREALAIRQA
jgi:hypothetical protein